MGSLDVTFSMLAQASKLLLELENLLVTCVLEIRKNVSGLVLRANELVEFEMNRLRVAVLSRLDQKDHEKCDDGRARVDDELPRVAEPE